MPHEICDIFGRVTKEEAHARENMISCIRLCFLSRPPFGDDSIREAADEFDRLVDETTSLTDAYQLLTPEQAAALRQMIEEPAVRVRGRDGKEWWLEENLDLLARLERGEPVGPARERQIARAVGTKVL